MNKEIHNYNDKGDYHGYNEWYLTDKIWARGNYKNGKVIAYHEFHCGIKTLFYIK